MTTVEYAAWARHAERAFGDFRVQQTLSSIGSMLSGLGGPSASVDAEAFTPWLQWPGQEPPSVEEQVAGIDWGSVHAALREKLGG